MGESVDASVTTEKADDPEAAIEHGRRLFAGRCDFLAGIASIDALPAPGLPEIAFAGRSNVGKSTLINALTGRRSLARTSRTPGRTRQLNFFDLGGRLMLVDLPGYGYARASKTEIAQWNRLVRAYLRGRAGLKRLCLLIDARHGLHDSDRALMAMLDEAGVAFQGVLTKADKTSGTALQANRDRVRADLAGQIAAHPRLIVTSARTQAGVPDLRAELAALASAKPLG